MTNYLFLISRGLNGRGKAVNIFMEKDITRAKIYFEGYILDNEDYNQYKLYRIGEIDERFRVKENYCFITGGYEIKHIKEAKKRKINQIKLNIENDRDERIKKEQDTIKIIEMLFNGVVING